jgi:RHS repeat-associated protein
MVSKDAYYPFGMRITGLSQTVDDPDPRYKYNGKELDEEKGLDWLAYGARYYDPEIGRWHVVDPAGQYWNSYSYGGNNSLNGLDPDGRFFIIDDFLFGFMSGIFTGASLESSANWGLSLAKNSTKLWGSFFQGDAHQIVSKFTWELPQQLSGVFWGHTNNMFSNVLDVRQYDDVTHVKMGTEMALTLGNIIITSFGVSTDPYAFGGLFRHETGHYVQSQYLGPLYLPLVGFPSIITATFTRNHHMYPWETTAQRLGKLKYPAGGRVE